jgi:hypothetical protein
MFFNFSKRNTVHNLRSKSVLFILRKREDTWGQTDPQYYNSSGLLNAAKFVCDMLNEAGVKAHLVQAIDGNCIDREVFKHNPDVVILEAIWATPDKLRELTALHHHRHRKWIVRNHSEMPFLAMEGISLQWLLEYSSIKNVIVSCNSPVATKDVSILANVQYDTPTENIVSLCNYYPIVHKTKNHRCTFNRLNVSCFGAVRILKNHVEQAIGAIMFAKRIGMPLDFHVNVSRIEGPNTVLKSLRAVFGKGTQYRLIEHEWLNRPKFLELCSQMDVGLQVSFSETFNIVGADLVSEGVPCVTSDEVPWMPAEYHANPSDASDIADKMVIAFADGPRKQLKGLHKYVNESKETWLKELERLTAK